MGSHNPNVYEELLFAFREGYAQYGDSAFILEALSQDERESLPDEYKLALFGSAGSIATPWSQWTVWGSCLVPVNYPTKELYAKVVQLSQSAFQCFEPLARRAGAHLPSMIRDAFPADAPDAQSCWASLLWWMQVPDDEEYEFRANRRRLVAVSPFEDSARVIEELRLVTDSPEMPFCLRADGDPGDPTIVFEIDDEEAATDTKCTHSSDFSSVNWYGKQFTFTSNQSKCVRILWEHWKRDRLSVRGTTIRDEAEISSTRLDNVFRLRKGGTVIPHPAWGTMIGPGDVDGTYRLIDRLVRPK